MTASIRAARQTLTTLGVNHRNFRDTQALLHAAKVATAIYRAKVGA